MRGLKAFGDRIDARDPDRQIAEIHIRVALINRFNALGTADVIRAAQDRRGRGELTSYAGLAQQRRYCRKSKTISYLTGTEDRAPD